MESSKLSKEALCLQKVEQLLKPNEPVYIGIDWAISDASIYSMPILRSKYNVLIKDITS